MSFDPQVVKLFEMMRASGVPPLAAQTVEQARLFYRAKTAMLGGFAEPMAEVRGIMAIGPSGYIPLRLYRPVGGADKSPALIYVHGGGWVIGDLDSHDKVCRSIAAKTPCSVVAIDYRLAPEFPFPAGLNDVIAASKWVSANASALGIDKDRIGIGGDSAGGNMSAAACLDARESGPRLRAQVLIYPSTDNAPESHLWPSRLQNAQVPPLTSDALKWFSEKHAPGGPDRYKDERLSPLRAGSLAGLPPALILTAEYDPLRDEGKAFADRLSGARVSVIYRDFPGQIHGFIEFGGILTASGIAIQEIAAFLRERL
jgi:acetyl esterase